MLHENLRLKRKERGLSQEELASRLHVVRQTISKWETDETLPDIRQSKQLSVLYHLSLDELIDFDIEQKEIEQMIEKTSDEMQEKMDWNKIWSKKYPILVTYKQQVRINDYMPKIREMLNQLKADYGYHDLEACLVLKDMLARTWKSKT